MNRGARERSERGNGCAPRSVGAMRRRNTLLSRKEGAGAWGNSEGGGRGAPQILVAEGEAGNASCCDERGGEGRALR